MSVVIPLHQAAPWVTATLDSVAHQTRPVAEVVVVDDGSTDGGGDIARSHPLRPTVLRQDRAGPAAARNRGVAVARGPLIAFLDADDLWKPDKNRLQVASLARVPEAGMGFAHAECFTEGPEGRQTWGARPTRHGRSLLSFLWTNQAPASAVMMPRAVLLALGGFDTRPSLVGAEDYHLWLRVVERYRAVYLRHTLVSYRVRTDSLVGAGWARNTDRGWEALAAWLEEHPRVLADRFHLPTSGFLAARAARDLGTSVGTRGVSWQDRRVALGRAMAVANALRARERARPGGGSGSRVGPEP